MELEEEHLPKEEGRVSDLYQYQGFWYAPDHLRSTLACQSHFRALASDILLVTAPKSGTTWLKALLFAVVNRSLHPINGAHPLTTHNPHDLVPFLELKLYSDVDQLPDLSGLLLLGSRHHLAVGSLPSSVLDTNPKIVYLCRNPCDTFVSLWHFVNRTTSVQVSFEEAFDKFCGGVSICGPFWDHVLGYWRESLKEDSRVLFLKYEDVKRDPRVWVRRLAEFLGCPLSEEEERDGLLEMIVGLCSFQNLSNLEVNKNGVQYPAIDNKAFFRRGEIGDSANYLTPEMIRRLDLIIQEKLHGSGLSF